MIDCMQYGYWCYQKNAITLILVNSFSFDIRVYKDCSFAYIFVNSELYFKLVLEGITFSYLNLLQKSSIYEKIFSI